MRSKKISKLLRRHENHILELVDIRFQCVGGYFCEGKTPHVIGCPAAYRHRAYKLIEEIIYDLLELTKIPGGLKPNSTQ